MEDGDGQGVVDKKERWERQGREDHPGVGWTWDQIKA